MLHFWRGAFDGDGSICRKERGQWAVSMCGTEEIVSGFRSFLRNSGIGANASVRRLRTIWCFGSSGKSLPLAVCELLYGKAMIFLERKRALYLQMKGESVLW